MIPVYRDTDTEEKFEVIQNGLPYDLTAKGITRVDAFVSASQSELSEDRVISSEASEIEWTADILTIRFGSFNLLVGEYVAFIKFFDISKPDGFVIDQIPIEVKS